MTLYIDINEKKLVQTISSNKSVSSPIFMRGDNEPIEIVLVDNGDDGTYFQKTITPDTDFIKIAIARFSDAPNLLSYTDSYSLSDTGSAILKLPFNTSELKTALENQQSISALIEVEYSNTDGTIITILQTACTVKNQLIDDSPTVEIEDQYYTKTQTDVAISTAISATKDYIKMAIHGGDEEYAYLGLIKINGQITTKIYTKEEVENV